MIGVSPPAAAPTVDRADPWKHHRAVIRAVRREIDEVTTYELEFADASTATHYRFAPGQFNMLYLPGYGEAAISLSGDPSAAERWHHTVRGVGNVTHALARCRVGDSILVRGPFGTAWPVDACRGRDVLVAAGGLGLAPLRPLLYTLMADRAHFRRLILVYGARSPQHLLYRDEYSEWASRGLSVHITVDRGDTDWSGSIGTVPALLTTLDLDSKQTTMLTCGPEIMMRFAVLEALGRGLPRDAIHVSLERNMSCAVGFCGHCQLGPAFICRDGPVFRFDRVEPYFHVDDL